MKIRWLGVLTLILATLLAAAGQPQTTCPVMKGNAVDKTSPYVDVNGYRIYVCCGACLKAVKADPDKYIAAMQAEGVELEKTPEARKDE